MKGGWGLEGRLLPLGHAMSWWRNGPEFRLFDFPRSSCVFLPARTIAPHAANTRTAARWRREGQSDGVGLTLEGHSCPPRRGSSAPAGLPDAAAMVGMLGFGARAWREKWGIPPPSLRLRDPLL